ncbi:MAG: VOC family protein [Myxococcota bacterium]
MELRDAPAIAFLATVDPVRARSFYEGVLGLRILEDSPFALVTRAGPTMIRIQKVESFSPHPFTALGFEVVDIGAAIRGLAEKGVVFERYGFMQQDELGVWSAPGGAKIAWFKDPDGNTLSLSQF